MEGFFSAVSLKVIGCFEEIKNCISVKLSKIIIEHDSKGSGMFCVS